MTDNIDKLMAEAFVECGYADGISEDGRIYHIENWYPVFSDDKARRHESIDPFADTLEGRRQKDALIDWLQNKHAMLWVRLWLNAPVDPSSINWRKRQLQVLRACFKQLAEQS